MSKYIFYLIVLTGVAFISFICGKEVGKSNSQVEYITKEIEVIKYVENVRNKIYSQPHASRSQLLVYFNEGKL
nr:MAG TPA: hypothetical protein [Caudoviricetes sp.]